MTNEEFYKDKLEEIMLRNMAVYKRTKTPVHCEILEEVNACDECLFYRNEKLVECNHRKKKQWLKAEHIEPEQQVDWSKVKVDTPIYVRDKTSAPWVKAHFAKYEEGKVCSWTNGTTSFSNPIGIIEYWNYAKLAESEEK